MYGGSFPTWSGTPIPGHPELYSHLCVCVDACVRAYVSECMRFHIILYVKKKLTGICVGVCVCVHACVRFRIILYVNCF